MINRMEKVLTEGKYQWMSTDILSSDYDDVLSPLEVLPDGISICYKADFDEGQRGDGYNWEEIPASYSVCDVFLDIDGHRVNIDGYLKDYLMERVESMLNRQLD